MTTVPKLETLTVEFKSDRKRLPDRELVQAVICLANTEGGELYLGVEPDGTPSGIHGDHEDLNGLAALIANRTVPPLAVRVDTVQQNGYRIARIQVAKSRRPVATSEGLLQRRRLMADGSPQCVPFYPHELVRRDSDLGLLDYTAFPVTDARKSDLDPAMRIRLRSLIERYHGDRTVLELSDNDFDSAMGFTRTVDRVIHPTVAGLLLIGKQKALKLHVPAHEIAFQVLDGTAVRFNQFYREPLAYTFERVLEHFQTRDEEEEVLVNGFRVPVPAFDPRAFREAFANAVVHRDYTRLGALHIQWLQDGLQISNPGGFMEGVELDRLLVVDPTPRNPLLADIFKRTGIVERTGRGVDIIYEGTLRTGRQAPDYSASTNSRIVVRLAGGPADLPFVRLIVEAEKRQGTKMPVDALLALRCLRDEGSTGADRLARLAQRDETAARHTLEQLAAAGLVEFRGAGRRRQYLLTPAVYRDLGQPGANVRENAVELERKVSKFVKTHGRITRSETAELCHLSLAQAGHLLSDLVARQILVVSGRGRAASYRLGDER